jgi:hypothetical protein
MVKYVQKPLIPSKSLTLTRGTLVLLLGRHIALSLQAGLNFAVFVGLRGLPLVASSLHKNQAKFCTGLYVQSRARHSEFL